jgi:hypothetical protein
MTDRFNTLTVVLEHEIREDDAEYILNAIRMIKGVISVESNVSNITDHMALETARHELRKKFYDLLK